MTSVSTFFQKNERHQQRESPPERRTAADSSVTPTSRHSSRLRGTKGVTIPGFFLDAFPAPRDTKSADFLSFDLFFYHKTCNFSHKNVRKFKKIVDFFGCRLEF